MESNRDLSDEALIALALGAKEDEAVPLTKADEVRQLVELFIVDNNIKAGTAKIKRYQVLDLFRRWSTSKIKDRVITRTFNRYFPVVFNLHYLLDPTPFNTSKDLLFAHRAKRRNIKLRRKIDRELAEKKAKQEKQSEISGPNSQCQPEDEMGTD